MQKIFFLFFLFLYSFSSSANEIKILSTTGMIADIVKNLAPNNILSYQMMKAGIDPHTYKPLARDLQRIQKATLILYNGFHLEANLQKIFEKLPNTVAICKKTDEKSLLLGNYKIPDPHLWMSIKLWQECVKEASRALQKTFPKVEKEIIQASKNYQKKLHQLEEWAQQKVAEIPPEDKILVTAHDAFQYFGANYGFEVRAIQGISTASEAGIQDIRKIADFVVKNKVPAIFLESSVAEHNIIALQQAVKARGWEVKIAEKLYSDSMGIKGSGHDSYPTMMIHNITSIVDALKK